MYLNIFDKEFDSPPVSDSEEESPRSPSPPPPKPVKIVIQETNDSDNEDDRDFNKSFDRAPSAKSVTISDNKHQSRVKDKFKPSMHPNSNFNKDAAAAKLYKALHDSPSDVDTVIDILTSHSYEQRKKITKAYKFNHNKVGNQ